MKIVYSLNGCTSVGWSTCEVGFRLNQCCNQWMGMKCSWDDGNGTNHFSGWLMNEMHLFG